MAAPAAPAAPRPARTPGALRLTACLLCLACALGAALAACDCDSDKGARQPLQNAVRSGGPAFGQASSAWAPSTLDDVLTPELVQSYLVLQLHRAALDVAERERRAAGAAGAVGPSVGGARGGGFVAAEAEPLHRAKRLAVEDRDARDVPVVAGLSGWPSASALVSLRPRTAASDDSNDVPVFKGNHEGTPLIHVVTPPPAPAAAARASGRGGLRASTVPTVPVVKGAPDPAHPTTPRIPLLPGDLQLTPEEEEALSVLLEGRHKKPPTPAARPAPRPALRPAGTSGPAPPAVTSISGKVGSKPPSTSVPAVSSRRGGSGGGGGSGGSTADCCNQKRLLQELERQLAILRRLNADHLREEWVRASYPSPYYPYLHNLPVHPSRGYDGAPAFLPADWRRGRRGNVPPSWHAVVAASAAAPDYQRSSDPGDCSWSSRSAPDVQDDDEEDGGELDDKVRFSEQLREVDDLQGADPQDDVGVDPKIGDPVDFEVR